MRKARKQAQEFTQFSQIVQAVIDTPSEI